MAGVVLFILGIVGLALIARGLAGRRVGKEPRCRGCLYDLSGIADRAKSCPECGASLSSRKAVVIGLRRRRVGSLLVGLVFATITSGIVGVNIWAEANDFDFNTIKPTWWLLREVRANPNWDDEALTSEIASRLNAGTLSGATIDRYAAIVLNSEPPEPDIDFFATPGLDWAGVFSDLATNTNTTAAARLRLASFALERLAEDPEAATKMFTASHSPVLLEALDQMLLADMLIDEHVKQFLVLKVRPQIRLWNGIGPADRPISARFTMDWLASDRTWLINGGWSRTPPFGARVLTNVDQPVLQLECELLSSDSQVVHAQSGELFMSPQGELTSSDTGVPTNDSTQHIALSVSPRMYSFPDFEIVSLRAPKLPGRYITAFEVRITLLNPDPMKPGSFLTPDDTNIVVNHRIEVPLIVESTDETTTRPSTPAPGR